MNEDILKLFDNLPDDNNIIIWNLGDVFFSKMLADAGIDCLKSYVSRMKGTKRTLNLVLGNHDKTILKTLGIKNKSLIQFFTELGFDKAYDHPIIIEDKYILCHEPVYIGKNSPFKVIYGHTHNTCVEKDYFVVENQNLKMENIARKKNNIELLPEKLIYTDKYINPKDYINVCLDYNHKILKLDDVIDLLENKQYKGQTN